MNSPTLPPPPPPKPRPRVWPWILLALIALGIGGLIYAAVRGLETDGGISANDRAAVHEANAQLQAFNAAANPLVADYNDSQVTAREWVRRARPHLSKMEAAVEAMEEVISSVEDPAVYRALVPLSQSVREEYTAMTELNKALDHLDRMAERRALGHLRRAAEARRQVTADMLERLGRYVERDKQPPVE